MTGLLQDLQTRYLLVGDDFRFGAKRAGDYALLDAHGSARGLDVARMMSYEVHGLRVSSSAVRQALADGDMDRAAALLGRPYRISGHVVYGRQLGRQLGASAPGREDGFRTLNVRVPHAKPAAMGIFVVQVMGLTPQPLPGVASLGVRPPLKMQGGCCWRCTVWSGPCLYKRAMAAWWRWTCCTSSMTSGTTGPCKPWKPALRRM